MTKRKYTHVIARFFHIKGKNNRIRFIKVIKSGLLMYPVKKEGFLMKLESLYIKKFKLIENSHIFFAPEKEYPDHYYQYFNNNNFTILVGENGTGKTTLLSFIANMFSYLQRYHDRIPSDFCLKYKINHENFQKGVVIEKEDLNVFITVEGIIPKSVLLEFHPQRGYVVKEYQESFESVTYEMIRPYLPTKVITSVFSLHNEYYKRPTNYVGDRIVDNYDISNIYGSNHYSFASLTKGIYRFLKLYRQKSDVVDELLSLLNITFKNKVMVRSRLYTRAFYELTLDLEDEYLSDEQKVQRDKFIALDDFIAEYTIKQGQTENDKWVDVCEENYYLLLKYEDDELLFFNDLWFEKEGEFISLGNMSSGEKMFFIRILSLLSSIENDSLIIMEEPELHLNPSWTKQIITMLQMLFSDYNVHFLISTHSHAFINTLFPENILIANNGKFNNPKFNTFLANESEISNNLFRNSKKLNYVENVLWKRVMDATPDDLEEIIDYLGESYTRFKIFNILLEKQGSNNDVED